MASQKGGQFLSLPSAARMPSSKKHVRHPGYSLFKVYNVTRFLKYHPGRKAQLMRGAGVDCTELFDKAPRI
jgi:hypothetical protein